MKFFGKALGLTLAALALSSCGGGGGDGGATSAPVSGKIELSATTTTLPVNVWGYTPTQYGNPTQAEVTIIWRNADGSLVTGHDVAVSIAPTNVAVLSCLVDGDACTDGSALFGSMTIKGINGQATIFVNSFTTAGTATLTVSATDPATTRTVSNTLKFTVTSGVGPTPASIALKPSTDLVYMPSSGSNSAASLSATVMDGSGQLVPDPGSGNNVFDNLKVELVGDVGDASLSTNSAAGSSSGKVVTTHTVHGAATIAFHAGDSTPAGPVQIRATADRADNDVDNGIQDAVTTMTSITVADGKLFSLVMTTPTTNDITVNPVSDNVSGGVVPSSPDGTYSMTVSALATDRQGNPVAPGTTIEFGVVDSPMEGFPANGSGSFPISGNDGDPQESGTLFNAPTGHFVTAGGGAGPGDTLLVFGGNETFGGYGIVPPGNRDLNSARSVRNINSEISLNVTYPFNPNDDSGSSVNNGPVLPYVIGRATEGNIGASAVTDVNGVARTTLNYPVSRLGKGALIWARGSGASANGTPRLVTTMSAGGFAGVAPGYLLVDQTPIMGNKTVPVQVCLYDALDAPIQGAFVKFSFSGLGAGTGSVDGVAGTGVLAEATGSDGCATALVATSGLVGGTGGGSGSGSPMLTFSAGPRVPALPVPINAPDGGLQLQASPSTLGGSGGSVTLQLTDSSGNPVVGGQITGVCDAGASLALIPATGPDGKTIAIVTADLDAYGKTQTAKCTFSGPGSSPPTAVVNLQGSDLCLANPTSPQCAAEILTALPQTLAGSGGTVSLVLTDAGGNPLPDVQIGGVCTAGASAGAISLTNSVGRTSVAIAADLDGYGSSESATCTFSAGANGPTVTVYIQGADVCTTNPTDSHCGSLLLQALPSSLGGAGGNVTLLLTDAGGSPLAGVQIVGTCQAGAGIPSAIAPTAANGRTTTTISANLDAYGTVNTSSCTFSTGLSNGPTVTVNLAGVDLCTRFPNDSRCTGGSNEQISVVIVRGTAAATVGATVTSSPAGVNCSLAANANGVSCSGSFSDGASIVLNAASAPVGSHFGFSGACSQVGSSNSATMAVAAGASCTVTVNN